MRVIGLGGRKAVRRAQLLVTLPDVRGCGVEMRRVFLDQRQQRTRRDRDVQVAYGRCRTPRPGTGSALHRTARPGRPGRISIGQRWPVPPSLITAHRTRSSRALMNIVIVPPPEWPAQPILLPSTSGLVSR